MEAKITAQSQTHRLRERAGEAQIRHGQEVRADIPNVRVGSTAGYFGLRGEPRPGLGEAQVFFCNIGPIQVHEVHAEGDDDEMPSTVTIDGLDVPHYGRFDLLNVLVRSNGNLSLVLDEQSRVSPIVEQDAAIPL